MAMPIRNKKGDVIAALGFGLRPERADDPVYIQETLAEVAKTVAMIDGLMQLRG